MAYSCVKTPRSRLLERTVELLRCRPRTLTLAMIEFETRLPKGWLHALLMHKEASPSVDRVVVLYEYLSKHKLEIH